MSPNNKIEQHDWSDDPQLTAYALGELEGAEEKAFEERIAGDSGAQALVEELRAFGDRVEAGFAEETAPELTQEQRGVIEEQIDGPTESASLAPVLAFRHRKWMTVAASMVVAGIGGAMIVNQMFSSRAPEATADLLTGIRKSAELEMPQSVSIGFESSSIPVGGGGGAAGKFGRRRNTALRALGYGTANDGGFHNSASREGYQPILENAFQLAVQTALSTFSIDVDTASYANLRRFLDSGQLPPRDAVRIEELINYFTYDYPAPVGEHPFSVDVEVGSSPWSPSHRLVRIGLKGRATLAAERPSSNLVFLLDVSGSMNNPDKLPLLKRALQMLVQELDERDTVSIVVYAGASGLALAPTPCNMGVNIHMALEELRAGGSTNGGAGIELAYNVAAENFIKGGINRVILATDGDFNVGISDDGSLVRLIEEKAKTGVFLSVLGFGTGNLQDSKMEMLADKGNGNYAYIDSVLEARKVLVEQMGSTLEVIAKDVKIQVEFNPHEVQAYRLIGYENRMLAAQDFNDDTKDAGEIGAGHTVTAIYEVVPVGVVLDVPGVDPLKYQAPSNPSGAAYSGELLTVKFRYKQPDGDASTLLAETVVDQGADFQELSADTRWAAAVAGFGMFLRDSSHKGTTSLEDVARWAAESLGEDPGGYRTQFIGLVAKAAQLQEK